MDKTGRTKTFLGRRNVSQFFIRAPFALEPVTCAVSSLGDFHLLNVMLFFLCSLPPLMQEDWSVLFPRNSLWSLAGQCSANGFALSARASGNIHCVLQMGTQDCCCLTPLYVSSTCTPARCFFADWGEEWAASCFFACDDHFITW